MSVIPITETEKKVAGAIEKEEKKLGKLKKDEGRLEDAKHRMIKEEKSSSFRPHCLLAFLRFYAVILWPGKVFFCL